MIINCNITYLPIVQAAAEQTAVDFKALIVGAKDDIYSLVDDFVITQDEYEQCLNQLRHDLLDDFLLRFSPYIKEMFRDDPRDMFVSFEVTKAPNNCLLQSSICTALKFALLLWWYSTRSQSHYTFYTQCYVSAMQNVSLQIRPHIIFKNGSYY